MQRVSRAILVGHVALALLFVVTGNWILLFVVTLAPFVARWRVILTRVPQHAGIKPSIPDWRLNTRTYTAGPITRFFYWNINYHVEHHMYAAVPYYNLPQLRKAIEGDLPVVSKGFVGTWREKYGAAKRH
jgi:fatty acid desaturase